MQRPLVVGRETVYEEDTMIDRPSLVYIIVVYMAIGSSSSRVGYRNQIKLLPRVSYLS